MILVIRGTFFLSIILIFYLSLLPASELEFFTALSFIVDKISHGGIFFYLAILGLFCNFKINNQILMVIIFSFGLTIEIVHYFHPYRYFEWADLLANFLGIIFAGAIHKTLQKT